MDVVTKEGMALDNRWRGKPVLIMVFIIIIALKLKLHYSAATKSKAEDQIAFIVRSTLLVSNSHPSLAIRAGKKQKKSLEINRSVKTETNTSHKNEIIYHCALENPVAYRNKILQSVSKKKYHYSNNSQFEQYCHWDKPE